MGTIVADVVDEVGDEVEEVGDDCVEHCEAIPARHRSTSEIIELFLMRLLENKVAISICDTL